MSRNNAPANLSEGQRFIAGPKDPILLTGASGFVGSHVVESLLRLGFCNLRCLVRPSSDVAELERTIGRLHAEDRVEIATGNLLVMRDCVAAARGAAVIIHLATARDGKSYADAFMNSVVTTRNLLDAARENGVLKRFVNISSLAVYTNRGKPQGRLLDENCAVEEHAEERGDAYSFAKVEQDKLVLEYASRFGIPYVILRPGYVLGPGKESISSRVGIDTFGVFLHLGGSNAIPFTYLDNCADAIALASVKEGVDGEVFNIVDDELPSSRRFLKLYKKNVKRFHSLYVPHWVSYLLCYVWERYSAWSQGQLPPTFNRRHWHAFWKSTRYSNARLKQRLGWTPRISMAEGMQRFFQGCREGSVDA